METGESNRFGLPYQIMGQHNETLDNTLSPYWCTIQAIQNPGSAPSPILNPYAAGSCFYPSFWANQAGSTQLQYDSLHDPRRLFSYPMPTGGAALAFSEKVHRIFGEKNLDSMKKCDENLQPIPMASESKGLLDEGHDANKDILSIKNPPYNMILGIGCDALKATRIQNCNAVHANGNFGLPTSLKTGLNAAGTNSVLPELTGGEMRKERKKQSNREAVKRSRMRKQQECEELSRTVEKLRVKNSSLKKKLIHLAEKCEDLTTENNSIEEELVKTYGAESISYLMHLKPTDSVAGGN